MRTSTVFINGRESLIKQTKNEKQITD